ncbi:MULTISPECIES: hypothetical protein [unclassified Burkholderia]|uniref:hypothetical protein n=1 Tax=unclassified Burkholderia TaxID=2613784 RepID=UPI000A92DEEB|nr:MULTISPECIES: hypothetical protein [unclassified Burkholderia]
MDNTIEIASNARSAVSALIRRLLVAYRVAETPQSQRDFLLQLRAVNETVALIEPLTRFNRFTELEELDVSAAEMAELLSGYRTNLTRPEEKIYFARVQNCVLRGQVIDRQAGGERVLRMIRDLQRDSDHKLVLM